MKLNGKNVLDLIFYEIVYCDSLHLLFSHFHVCQLSQPRRPRAYFRYFSYARHFARFPKTKKMKIHTRLSNFKRIMYFPSWPRCSRGYGAWNDYRSISQLPYRYRAIQNWLSRNLTLFASGKIFSHIFRVAKQIFIDF